MNNLFQKECDKWLELNRDRKKFRRWLSRNGWVNINKKRNGMFKSVYKKDSYVIKFDEWKDSSDHTFSEYLSYVHSSKERKSYICKPYLWYKGLLFQPLLENVCDNIEAVPRKVHILARKFKFSHYWNYGYLGGKVQFFDVDSLYYVLTDREERVY